MTTNKVKKSFVFIKENIDELPMVQKNDVGIVESVDKAGVSTIFFIKAWVMVELPDEAFEVFDVKKTGDGFPKKICNICHKLLDTDNFAKNQNGINNRTVRRPSCQDCRKGLEGINLTSADKKEWLKNKPTDGPYECPICLKRTIAGVTSKVVLDHNHTTGEVRGWICDSCNTGIGRFKDDKEIIHRAIKFL